VHPSYHGKPRARVGQIKEIRIVPKTLLAVDDSVTMRKVLEITFGGDDFKVTTADSHQAALAKLAEKPSVVLIDTVLGNEDGYALAKEVRKQNANATIVLLSSRYNPYDQAKGKDAGADDYMDKPFDTQQLIDKVKKAMAAREGGVVAQPAASPAAPAVQPKPQPQPMAAAAPKPTQQSMGGSARAATMVFGDMAPPPAKPAPAAPAASPAATAPAAVSASVNGHLAGKLGELGLTPQQADAVLALSRDVVERVVWEVVPQLAEAIIKEEIARLTKD
jgi:DNA-binding response OmpR family regulator